MQNNNFKPKDYLGQNFLEDEEALEEIISAADLKPTDTVLEVGPGLGVLTKELLKQVKEVIAVEKDARLVKILHEKFSTKKLKLFNEDILKFHLKKYLPPNYKVVANIPYYLTSKLFQIFLETDWPPSLLVLMVQKEVGERVVAKPGQLSILGISVQVYADAEIVADVPKESFSPQPEVDSVILKLTPRNKYPEIKDKELFFRIVKTAFAGKRKQIKNTIQDLQALSLSGINPMSRAQDLSIVQWIRLYKEFRLKDSGQG